MLLTKINAKSLFFIATLCSLPITKVSLYVMQKGKLHCTCAVKSCTVKFFTVIQCSLVQFQKYNTVLGFKLE